MGGSVCAAVGNVIVGGGTDGGGAGGPMRGATSGPLRGATIGPVGCVPKGKLRGPVVTGAVVIGLVFWSGEIFGRPRGGLLRRFGVLVVSGAGIGGLLGMLVRFGRFGPKSDRRPSLRRSGEVAVVCDGVRPGPVKNSPRSGRPTFV